MKAGGVRLAVALAILTAEAASSQTGVVSVPYVADEIVPARVAPGFAIVVEFAADEAVDNVIVGNSAAWQVTPNRRGDRLVVKPLANPTTTNMVVVTDLRRYIFRLEPDEGGGHQMSVMRFAYPPPAPATSGDTATGGIYRLRGARALYPIAMGDDGTRTTIRWGRDADLPAIFAVDAKGGETLVNGRMVGEDYVIEGVATRYVIRIGKSRAVATRVPRPSAR